MKLGLQAIVRNEAKRIERMLSSCIVAGINTWVIVDTGSTDGTIRRINTLAKRHQADLHLVHLEWPDSFAVARNFALKVSADVAAPSHWLILDADEVVVRNTGARLEDADLIHIPRYADGDHLTIQAPRIIRAGALCHWEGAVHECLRGDPGASWLGARSTAYEIKAFADGWRSTGNIRQNQNYALAMRQLDETPHDSRALFYGGLCAEGAGHRQQAINLLEARAKMYVPGDIGEEESWYAAYRAAFLRALNKDLTAPFYLMRAYAARPHRSEPLAMLALYWRDMGYENLCQLTFPPKRAWPASEWLFVDPTLYEEAK